MELKRLKQLAGLSEDAHSFIQDLLAFRHELASGARGDNLSAMEVVQEIDKLIRKHYGQMTDM